MVSGDIVLLIAIVILVSLGGLFAAIEAAYISASTARVQDLVREERTGANALLQLLPNRVRYVNLMVLLRISCEIVATTLLVSLLQSYMNFVIAIAVASVVMIIVSYVAIGVGPRTLGRQHALSIGCASAAIVTKLAVILTPITRILIWFGNVITPGKGFRNGPFATEIELREMVDMASQRGIVADDERRMIQSVFDLRETAAREIMVPRPEIVWIESEKTAQQAVNLAVRSGHSRIPVIGENVDDIQGVLYLKDITRQTLVHGSDWTTLKVASLMRQAQFIPDSKRLDDLLDDMQRSKNHMAVLVNEYGSIAGLVTIEDVLEEIVGEINDEYDAHEVAPYEMLDGDGNVIADGASDNPPANTGMYRVSARLHIDDLAELYGIHIDEDEVDTVGGLIGLALGRVPLPGATVKTHGLILQAEGGEDRRGRQRISTVRVYRDPEVNNDTNDETATMGSHKAEMRD